MGQDLLNKVYMEAMKLKSTSLSKIELEEKLMMMGYPEEMVKQATQDILYERQLEKKATNKNRIFIGLTLLAVGILLMVGTYVFFETLFVLPIGILAAGIIYVTIGLIGTR